MSHTSEKLVKTSILMFAFVTASVFSLFVVFPLAAWNHNFILMITALLTPAFLQMGIRAMTGTKAAFTAKSFKSFLFPLLVGFLLWHHLWLLFIIVLVVTLVRNTTFVTEQ